MSKYTANEYDKLVYEKELKDFLPDKMLDAHVHISKNGLTLYRPPKKPVPKDWTALVSCEMSVEDFVEVGKEMFPRQQMSALIFGMTHTKVDEANEYVIGSNRDYGFPMLCRSDYVTPADELEAKVKAGGFLGLKPYLSNRPPYIPIQETRIYDYLPQHHLEVANKNGWIVMLHIPRNEKYVFRLYRQSPR